MGRSESVRSHNTKGIGDQDKKKSIEEWWKQKPNLRGIKEEMDYKEVEGGQM